VNEHQIVDTSFTATITRANRKIDVPPWCFSGFRNADLDLRRTLLTSNWSDCRMPWWSSSQARLVAMAREG